MEVNEIRKFLAAHPFKPFEIHLDNGETQLITHPEVIVTDTLIVAVDKNGEVVFMASEAISAIKVPTKPNASK